MQGWDGISKTFTAHCTHLAFEGAMNAGHKIENRELSLFRRHGWDEYRVGGGGDGFLDFLFPNIIVPVSEKKCGTFNR